MSDYRVFLSQPNAGSIMPCCVQGLGSASMGKHHVRLMLSQFGNVSHNFNMLWCQALNERTEHGLTHFAMLHADVGVAPGWVDVLIEEMDRLNSDVMTAIVPIKDGRGLTTTGIRYPGVWGTRRYTMTEVMRFPETFSIHDVGDPESEVLAINTGCWIARIDTGWADKFPGFTDKYRICWVDGLAQAWFDSEDWLFSDWAASQALRVHATRRVQAFHSGGFQYPNTHAWGSCLTDPNAPTRPITPRLKALEPPGIRIETSKPVAVDSHDHTHPLGTIQDNSTSPAFLKKLFDLIPAQEVCLLDLGCAGGGLVRSILEAGGFAVGVEGSDISRRLGRAEWPIIPDWLFTADCTEPFQLENGHPLKFNVVTGWEFLEHIPEDRLEAVVANIRRHAEPNALFIGSISSQEEPHHATARPREWWITRLAKLSIHQSDAVEAHFGNDLVRGSHESGAISFSFAGAIA